MKKEKLEINEKKPDYLYRLLLAEQHENQLLQAKIQSLIVKNESYAFGQKTKYIFSILKKNRLLMLTLLIGFFIFLVCSMTVALFIYFKVF